MQENYIKQQIKISFKNCTFKDDVLAYIPDSDDSGYTFTASFEDEAIFINCTFERKAMFKYVANNLCMYVSLGHQNVIA